MESVINCVVVKDDGCSNSDHLPVRCELLLDTGQSAPSVDGSTDGDVTQSTHMKQTTYVKPKLTDPLFVATYTHNLRQELSKIPPLEPQRVDRDNAQCVIDSHTNLINRAMHAATRAGLSLVTPSGKTKRRGKKQDSALLPHREGARKTDVRPGLRVLPRCQKGI